MRPPSHFATRPTTLLLLPLVLLPLVLVLPLVLHAHHYGTSGLVLPLVLQLDADDPHGFVREWKPVYGIPPAKHRAYAMQWFTLAVVLAIIYIGGNTRRTGRSGTGDEETHNE